MLALLSSIINEGILIRYLCKMENSQCLQISKYVLQRPMLEQISKYKMKCLVLPNDSILSLIVKS